MFGSIISAIKFRERPVKLGKIKHDKVIGAKSEVGWNLDFNLAVMIRDYLRMFAKETYAYGNSVWTEEERKKARELSKEEYAKLDELKFKEWQDKVNGVADKFDVVVKDIENETCDITIEQKQKDIDIAFDELKKIYQELWY
jgi:acetolactate synthase small subunit